MGKAVQNYYVVHFRGAKNSAEINLGCAKAILCSLAVGFRILISVFSHLNASVSNGKRHVIKRKQTREKVCGLCLNANSCNPPPPPPLQASCCLFHNCSANSTHRNYRYNSMIPFVEYNVLVVECINCSYNGRVTLIAFGDSKKG